jgi:hypothetical protein
VKNTRTDMDSLQELRSYGDGHQDPRRFRVFAAA